MKRVIERVILILALAVAALIASWAIRTVARRKVGAVLGRTLPGDLVCRLQGGGVGIIYFHGAQCGECRAQAAILSRLVGERGISIITVDTARESAIASALAVMTVPSTVIVDRARHIRAVNLGFRGREALEAQLSGLM